MPVDPVKVPPAAGMVAAASHDVQPLFGAPPTQVPPLQTSPVVHGLPSLHDALLLRVQATEPGVADVVGAAVGVVAGERGTGDAGAVVARLVAVAEVGVGTRRAVRRVVAFVAGVRRGRPEHGERGRQGSHVVRTDRRHERHEENRDQSGGEHGGGNRG